MESPQRHHFEELFPEWFEVRAVAKTSRADGHQFAVFAEQFDGQRDESCVEIARLNAGFAQQPARLRIAIYLAVWRGGNSGAAWGLWWADQNSPPPRDRRPALNYPSSPS